MGMSTKDLSLIISVIPGLAGYPASHPQTGFTAELSQLEAAQDGPALPHETEHAQFSIEAGD